MKATAIKMKSNYLTNSLIEIDSIYIEGAGEDRFYKKEELYDKIEYYGWNIQVDRYPYPQLKGAISGNYEKYVRSSPNGTITDNLLELPRY